MKNFFADAFAEGWRAIEMYRAGIELGAIVPNDSDLITKLQEELQKLRDTLLSVDLVIGPTTIKRTIEKLPDLSHGEIKTHLDMIQHNVESELAKHRFMYVPPDRALWFDQAAAFGPDVTRAFPSAAFDITEAGNCYAADIFTAAVFHAMRALEPALEALAKEAKVPFNRKRFDQQTWQDVLNQIEARVKPSPGIRITPKRRERVTFLSQTAKDFYYFKEAWRNHVIHGRAQYDGRQALGIIERVRDFMQHLSSRLHERGASKKRKKTPP